MCRSPPLEILMRMVTTLPESSTRYRRLHRPYGRGGTGIGAGIEPAQLQSRQLHTARLANRDETEIGQKVVRKDRAMTDQPLFEVVLFAVAIGEGLQRLGAPGTRLAGGGQEERLDLSLIHI